MIAASDTGQLARRFWSWWMAELAACLPARLRRLARPDPRLALLRVSQPDAALRLVHGARSDTGPALAELGTHRRLMRDLRSGRITLVAILSPADVVTRHVTLPAAAERDLASVIRYEIERLAPFDPAEMLVASDLHARQPEARTITVRVRFVPLAVVAPVLERAAAAGIAGPICASTGDNPGRADLLRPLQPSAKARRRPTEWAMLIGVAALCIMLVFWLGIADRRLVERARASEAHVAQVRQLALEAQAPALDAETSVSPASRAAFELRNSQPLAIAILDALTAALEDDVVLERATLSTTGIEIAGHADAATGLIADLEAAAAFDRAGFSAPVRRDAPSGRDVFSIEARVAGDRAAGAEE